MGKKNNKIVSIEGHKKAVEELKKREENAPFIKLTYGQMEVILTVPTTKFLLDNKNEISVRTRHFLSLLVQEMSEKVKPFIQDRDKIYQEFCDRDENNEPIMIPDGRGGRRYTFANSNGAPGMMEKIDELAEIEHEFPIKRLWFGKKVVALLSGQDMLNVKKYADLEIPDNDD